MYLKNRKWKVRAETENGFKLFKLFISLAVSNLAGRLTMEKNKLKRKEEVGVNIRGKFYPPESKECHNVLESCRILNNMTAKNIIEKRRKFEQGPLKQKCLVFVNLYTNNKNGKNELNIINIYPNDKIELAWKRQLNKLYMKTYLKSA